MDSLRTRSKQELNNGFASREEFALRVPVVCYIIQFVVSALPVNVVTKMNCAATDG